VEPLKPADPAELGGIALRGRLGRGGMGTVYYGVTPDGEQVAVKMIREDLLEKSEARGRFDREGLAIGMVQGPRVANLITASPPDEAPPWFAVEYVRGLTLTEYVTQYGPLPTELAAALGIEIGDRVPAGQARAAVIELRKRKGMVIDPADPDTRSVGSFFVNPVLDAAALRTVEAAARARCGAGTAVPRFDAGGGLVKVPAAWLIERAGFAKGYSAGEGARISSKHTLALVNSGSATTAELMTLAREIRDGVRHAFGVSLTPEPVLVGVTL